MKIAVLLFVSSMLFGTRLGAQVLYHEQYRPQFHFSPSSGWIGDPDGLIHYQGTYHLFWWGHAVSSDLVYWSQQAWPMTGDDGTFGYYDGSVVVDTNNTGGFKAGTATPMVAVYTANNNSTGLQNQRLSICTNSSYTTFNYYSGNPVLDIGSTAFRDPDVFWDTQSKRWIMLIALPNTHQISIYASQNLKSWQLASQFGPVGARDQLWEVPLLFQLPVDGDAQNMKWVLVCSMGPNKMQYYPGSFDGTNFVTDGLTMSYLTNGIGLEGTVYANFEGTNYGSWSKTGTAFGSGPALGTLPNQQTVSGYLGRRLVNSYNNGDGSTGTLTSPNFVITNNCINFLIGGGNHPNQTCINLLVSNTVVATTTGGNDEILKWAGWNVSQWKGKTAKIQIVDNYTGGWGHINIDQVMFSDVLMNFNLEHANWIDWGSDFYAARNYRDYDNSEQCTYLLGWMGNWNYANNVPTSWGRGVESLPRKLDLFSSSKGYQLVQTPLSRFQQLRGPLVSSPAAFQPTNNTYEIETVFNLQSQAQNFGINLCVGGTNKVVVGYNATNSNVYLDRTASGNVSFNSSFPCIVTAPFPTKAGYIKFHIFVDQSSIEVFVNDGQQVLTSLIYPDPSSLGVQIFSLNGATTLRSFQAWQLKSIWP